MKGCTVIRGPVLVEVARAIAFMEDKQYDNLPRSHPLFPDQEMFLRMARAAVIAYRVAQRTLPVMRRAKA